MRDYIKKVIIGKHEQGYQAMKEDKGNYVDGKLVGTKFGISAPVLKQYLGRTPTVKDMKELKLKSALDILENQYYKGPKIDKLPESIRKNVLDMAINAGPGRAIKILQKLVGAKQDGAIGPKTLKKVKESKITNNDYVDARRDFYLNLVKRKPVYKKFKRGWLNRVESFRDKKPVKVVEKSIKVEEELDLEGPEMQRDQYLEDQVDLQGPEMQRDQYLENQDDDLTEEILNIKEEVKKAKPEIEPEQMPLDSPEPFGVFARGTEEFDIAEEQEKEKLMMAADGGEVKYQEGGEVYDVPEYLRRPEEDIVEEDFRIEQVVEEPEPEPDLSGPEFERDRYLMEQRSTQELMDTSIPGVGRPPQVNRELARRKREAESGFEVGERPELKDIVEEEKEEVVKVPEPEKTPEPPRLSKMDFLDIRKLQDEKELRKAEDEAIKQAQQMSTIDPKRFYKNMSTFDKVVSLIGLAAGAYGSYKYGSPNTFVQRLDREVEKDIKAQALEANLEKQKLAAANFKVSVLAKRLARSTKDVDKQQTLLNLSRTYQQKGLKEVKKQIKQKKDMADLSQLNKRGVTDEELAYLTVRFPKLKIQDTVIKGRDGLNYAVKGGASRANKVKEYVSDAQDSIDGLNELLTYVDKVTIFEQLPGASMFSLDAAQAESLRDRLVGKLRIEFFGPGVMTDQERENAKKILGDPNRFFTTDAREKAKIRNLLMKINYGVRQKLRADGLSLPPSPNEQKVAQLLERKKLSDNSANRVKVVDGLIEAEVQSVKKGNKPGAFWDLNEPLPI